MQRLRLSPSAIRLRNASLQPALRLLFHNRPKLCMMPDYFNGELVSNESELGTDFHHIKDRP